MVFVIYHWLSVLIISLISHISLSIILRERRVQQCSKKEETVGCADPERLLTEQMTLVTPPSSYVNLILQCVIYHYAIQQEVDVQMQKGC